jgi:hypothetical protein
MDMVSKFTPIHTLCYDIEGYSLKGDSYYGSLRMFSALASFFNRYFHPFEPVLPEHVVTGAGATAV